MAEVSRTRSASRGSSYGSEIPVKSLDQPGAGLGVQALAVARLAHLQRRGHVDEQEVADLGDHLPDLRPACAYGAIGAQMAMPPCRAISAAT